METKRKIALTKLIISTLNWILCTVCQKELLLIMARHGYYGGSDASRELSHFLLVMTSVFARPSGWIDNSFDICQHSSRGEISISMWTSSLFMRRGRMLERESRLKVPCQS